MNLRLLLFPLLLLATGAPFAFTREWTDATGKYKVEAEFDGVVMEKVRLVKPDGSILAVPLERLSERDQEYIRSLAETSGNGKPRSQNNQTGPKQDAGAIAPAKSSQNQVPEIHLVLFVAAGLDPPADAESKMVAAAKYTETFFVKWMKHWGYPPAREQIFPRDDRGRIRVLRIHGSKPPGQYTKAFELMQELWPKAHAQYGLPRNNPLWWVYVYKGDPPTRFNEYRGSGDIRRGGWAVVNYENRPGEISFDQEMAEGFLHDFTLKGCVHELGHAFGLFHTGPIIADRLGNTLMGPRTDPFRAAVRSKLDHDRVYLCEAEAAMLWKHFVFSGTAQDRRVVPSVEVQQYRARYDRSRNEIVVSGTLVSNHKAHSVVLVDESSPRQVNYWAKTYAARIEPTGEFQVRVREPSPAAGTFRLMFCFENGAITGDGKTSNPTNAFEKTYTKLGNDYQFEP